MFGMLTFLFRFVPGGESYALKVHITYRQFHTVLMSSVTHGTNVTLSGSLQSVRAEVHTYIHTYVHQVF